MFWNFFYLIKRKHFKTQSYHLHGQKSKTIANQNHTNLFVYIFGNMLCISYIWCEFQFDTFFHSFKKQSNNNKALFLNQNKTKTHFDLEVFTKQTGGNHCIYILMSYYNWILSKFTYFRYVIISYNFLHLQNIYFWDRFDYNCCIFYIIFILY